MVEEDEPLPSSSHFADFGSHALPRQGNPSKLLKQTKFRPAMPHDMKFAHTPSVATLGVTGSGMTEDGPLLVRREPAANKDKERRI